MYRYKSKFKETDPHNLKQNQIQRKSGLTMSQKWGKLPNILTVNMGVFTKMGI